MPKTKSTTKKTKSSKKTKKAAAEAPPAETTEEVAQVSAEDVTLAEAEPSAPEATADAAADSSAEDAQEEKTPHEMAMEKLQDVLEYHKNVCQQHRDQERTLRAEIEAAIRLVRSLKGKKRKTGAKKGSNPNSGISKLRQVSKQMHKFLGSDADATYSYTTLCGAVMDYGKDEKLVGMPTTNKSGEETTNNSYMRLNPKLKKLFPNFDDAAAVAAEAGKTTLIKNGKERWVSRAGLMTLIKPHFVEETTEKTEADETNSA